MNLPYYTYGIFMTLAFVGGVLLFAHNCRLKSIKYPPLWQLLLLVSISGVLGARIAYILIFPEQFDGIFDYLAFYEGGFVFYGGFAASIVCLGIYLKIKGYAILRIFDFFVPSLAFGHGLGRLGCLVNDCCYGSRTDFFHIYKINGESFYRHPAQLYESVFLFLSGIFFSFALHKQYRKEKIQSGKISCLYLICYSVFRFIVEFVRDDNRGGFYTTFNLSPSQIVSVGVFAISVFIMKYKKENDDNRVL